MKFKFKSEFEIEAEDEDEAWEIMSEKIADATGTDDLYICEQSG